MGIVSALGNVLALVKGDSQRRGELVIDVDLLSGKGDGEAPTRSKTVGKISVHGDVIAVFDDVVAIHVCDVLGLGNGHAEICVQLVHDISGKADQRAERYRFGLLFGLYPVYISAGSGSILKSRIQPAALQVFGDAQPWLPIHQAQCDIREGGRFVLLAGAGIATVETMSEIYGAIQITSKKDARGQG